MMRGEVVGGGQPVAARTDNDHVIGIEGLGVPPGTRPAPIPEKAVAYQGKAGIALHRSSIA
jgi:hypothetical protein